MQKYIRVWKPETSGMPDKKHATPDVTFPVNRPAFLFASSPSSHRGLLSEDRDWKIKNLNIGFPCRQSVVGKGRQIDHIGAGIDVKQRLTQVKAAARSSVLKSVSSTFVSISLFPGINCSSENIHLFSFKIIRTGNKSKRSEKPDYSILEYQ